MLAVTRLTYERFLFVERITTATMWCDAANQVLRANKQRRNFVSRQVIGQLRWWHAWPDPTGRSQHVSGSGQVVTDRWSLGCVPSGHGQHSWPWRWPPRRRCLRIHVCRCADSAASVSDSISTASHTTSSYNGKPTPIDTESLSSRTYQHPQLFSKYTDSECLLMRKGQLCQKSPKICFLPFNIKFTAWEAIHTLCLKKVPTFKLYVTLSNLNRFSKFLNCCKAYEI